MRQQHYFEIQAQCQYGPVSSLFLMTAFSLSGIELNRLCTLVKEIDFQDF